MPQEADSEMDAGCLLESALGVTPVEGRGGKQHWAEREKSICHTGSTASLGKFWNFVLGWPERPRPL